MNTAKKQITENEEKFLKDLASISGCKKTDLKEIICKKPNPKIDEFYTMLGEYKTRVELDSEKYLELKNLNYSKIFTNESENLMDSEEFKSFIQEYINRYNQIISNSKFFSKEKGFVPHNAEAIQVAVKKNKFLLVDNNAILFAGRKEPITTHGELEKAINEELKSIQNDEILKNSLAKFYNKFKNEGLRDFIEYISDNPIVITKLIDKENFKKSLLTYYFIELKDSYLKLITDYYNKQKEIQTERRKEKQKCIKNVSERSKTASKKIKYPSEE